MWSTYIMDLLLLLQAYGSSPDPDSDAYRLDFNGDGIISMYDFLEMLANQPPL
tara:strand:- start:637 stop:795 length:159 start_codon:yes stop_codon:yes gene_type:complete